MQADAIARTLYRLWFSRRNLLAWTTAAQLTTPSAKPPMLFFYISMASGAAAAGLSLLGRGALSRPCAWRAMDCLSLCTAVSGAAL